MKEKTKKRMRSATVLFVALGCSLASDISAETRSMYTFDLEKKVLDVTRDGKSRQIAVDGCHTERMQMPERQETGANECNVTVKAVTGFDFMPLENAAPVRIYNKSLQKNIMSLNYKNGDFIGETTLPAGTYDFMFIAYHWDSNHSNNSDYNAIVIAEDVAVGDGDNLVTLDITQAVNHVKYISYNHDGELSKEQKIRYVDNGGYEVVEEGNITGANIISEIIHKDYNMVDYTSSISTWVVEPSEYKSQRNDGLATLDFYVNDVSDKYEFRQIRMLMRPDGSSDVVILSQEGCDGDVTCVNDPSDYFETGVVLADTPLSTESAPVETKQPYSFGIGATLLGGEIPGLFGGIRTKNENLLITHVSPGKSTVEDPLAVIYWQGVYETEDKYFYTTTPYLYLASGNKSGYGFFTQDKYDVGMNGLNYGDYYPGHPGLAVGNPAGTLTFNDGCPYSLISFSEMNVGYDEDMMLIQNSSYGQKGELRGADELKSTLKVSYNGDVVLEDIDNLDNWLFDWVSEGSHFPGEYKINVTNENVLVDGINGKNEAETYFNQNNSDYYPPALQAYQLRDKNGNLSFRFENRSDGQLLVVGGDFNPIKQTQEDSDYYSMYYYLKPASLKVEYAPRGSDNFAEISARSDDNEYTYWGFNEFFRIPLDEVNVPSNDKWYDLRITFTDEAGNYQTQLMSPAFRIENVSAREYSEDDCVREQPEGQFKTFVRYGNKTVAAMGGTYDDVNNGMNLDVVFAPDGSTVWFHNILSSSTDCNSWVKGTISGETVTIPSGQVMTFMDYGTYYNAPLLVQLEVNEEADENSFSRYDCTDSDIVLNYKDGVFSMQEGQVIGLARNSSDPIVIELGMNGLWLGYADKNVEFVPLEESSISMPEGSVPEAWSVRFTTIEPYISGNTIDVLTVGDEIYVKGLFGDSFSDFAIKGVIDGDKARFPSGQYSGKIDMRFGEEYHLYCFAATYDDYSELYSLSSDEMVFDCDLANKTLKWDGTMMINRGVRNVLYGAKRVNPVLTAFSEVSATPATPGIAVNDYYLSPSAEEPGLVSIYIPCEDTERNFINPQHMGFQFFINGEKVTFTPDQCPALEEATDVIPYYFSDGNIFNRFNEGLWILSFTGDEIESLGVRSVYTVGGDTRMSEIATFIPGQRSVEGIINDSDIKSVEYYDIAGRKVVGTTNGVVIKRLTLKDGTVRNIKTINSFK